MSAVMDLRRLHLLAMFPGVCIEVESKYILQFEASTCALQSSDWSLSLRRALLSLPMSTPVFVASTLCTSCSADISRENIATTASSCSLMIFDIIFKANEVLPTDGRAASIIRLEG